MLFDNGLLKCYPEYANKLGMLEVNKLGKLGRQSKAKTLKDTQGIFSGLYYVKSCELGQMQIEVLLSQIVADYGVSTCKYFPAVVDDKLGRCKSYAVVSENVKGKDDKLLVDFIKDHRAINPYFKSPYEIDNEYTTEELHLPYMFTEKGLKEYVDAHIIRTACGDVDGHSANMVASVIDNRFLYPGKVDGITLIDYGMADSFNNHYSQECLCFCNGLGGGIKKTRDEMIELFKENEIVQSFYSNTEIAEKLGNLNVHDKVAEINNCLGFHIIPRIEDDVARNIDYVAEELIK